MDPLTVVSWDFHVSHVNKAMVNWLAPKHLTKKYINPSEDTLSETCNISIYYDDYKCQRNMNKQLRCLWMYLFLLEFV
jgi:hypothetical protein